MSKLDAIEIVKRLARGIRVNDRERHALGTVIGLLEQLEREQPSVKLNLPRGTSL